MISDSGWSPDHEPGGVWGGSWLEPEELADGSAIGLLLISRPRVKARVPRLSLAQTLAHGALYRRPARNWFSASSYAAHATVAGGQCRLIAPRSTGPGGHDVVVFQRHGASGLLAADAAVELSSGARLVVGVLVRRKKAVEQRLDRVLGRRLTRRIIRADGDASRDLVGRSSKTQGLRDERTRVQIVGVERAELVDVGRAQAAGCPQFSSSLARASGLLGSQDRRVGGRL